MGMTMTQKILAAHAGLESVKAGQLIEADLDLVLGNDITSPVAIAEMEKMNTQTVFDKDKIALVMDHFIPNKAVSYTHLDVYKRQIITGSQITGCIGMYINIMRKRLAAPSGKHRSIV